MNRRPLYIFDLDGTLALIDHRRHYVERPACPYCGWHEMCDHSHDGTRPVFTPNWDKFYAECVNDQPNIPVIAVFQMLFRHADIHIFSGRSDVVLSETTGWLQEHVHKHFDKLWMRKEGDYTPDHDLKRGWYFGLPEEDKQRLVAIFDDRDKVVAMWRELGLTCFQVAPGAF